MCSTIWSSFLPYANISRFLVMRSLIRTWYLSFSSAKVSLCSMIRHRYSAVVFKTPNISSHEFISDWLKCSESWYLENFFILDWISSFSLVEAWSKNFAGFGRTASIKCLKRVLMMTFLSTPKIPCRTIMESICESISFWSISVSDTSFCSLLYWCSLLSSILEIVLSLAA